jgi:DNA-directed RNA polymerase subunit alpha
MADVPQIAMPVKVEVDQETATPTYARFISEPWEKGYGNTTGNALRRILLSSMEGVAVTTLRVDGAAHEFTTIPDVVEDVTDIVLAVKRIHFVCDGELPRKLELVAEKAGPVTAALIKEDGVTEVLNPELVICHLDRDRTLRMEIEIDRGRGYRPGEENKREDHPIGVIPIDSLFSPVERVRYDVQACRVGQKTDFDRLELEVWTDGRIDPQVAMTRAAEILRDVTAVFLAGRSAPKAGARVLASAGPVTSEEDQALLEKLLKPVTDLELSVRAKNCLNNAEINVVGQLVEKAEDELLKFRNFGKKSLDEIKSSLEGLGLSLGTTLKDEVKAALLNHVAAQDKESSHASS